jgi:hypothetical protein
MVGPEVTANYLNPWQQLCTISERELTK